MANSGPTSANRAPQKEPPGALDVLIDFVRNCTEFIGELEELRGLPPGFRVPEERSILVGLKHAQGNPKMFALFLQRWLVLHGLNYPEGVFVYDKWKRPRGRPRKDEEADRVWTEFQMRGRPSFGQLAKQLYPDEYKKNTKATTDRVNKLYHSADRRHRLKPTD